jgi:hypothetical protein
MCATDQSSTQGNSGAPRSRSPSYATPPCTSARHRNRRLLPAIASAPTTPCDSCVSVATRPHVSKTAIPNGSEPGYPSFSERTSEPRHVRRCRRDSRRGSATDRTPDRTGKLRPDQGQRCRNGNASGCRRNSWRPLHMARGQDRRYFPSPSRRASFVWSVHREVMMVEVRDLNLRLFVRDVSARSSALVRAFMAPASSSRNCR